MAIIGADRYLKKNEKEASKKYNSRYERDVSSKTKEGEDRMKKGMKNLKKEKDKKSK